jgi:hypothetical protein
MWYYRLEYVLKDCSLKNELIYAQPKSAEKNERYDREIRDAKPIYDWSSCIYMSTNAHCCYL